MTFRNWLIAALLAAMPAVPSVPLAAQGTPADTADHKCIKNALDIIGGGTGGGNARNLANGAKPCNDRWIARKAVDTVTVPSKPDTVIVHDTLYLPPPTDGNKPPKAIIASVTCDTLRRCVARHASTDDVGVTAVAWTWGDGATSTAQAPTHTYAKDSVYRIGLTAADAGGLKTSVDTLIRVGKSQPPPPPDSLPTTRDSVVLGAAQPRSTPSAVLRPFTRSVPVPAGWDLQAALNAAQPGDRLELAASAVWKGNYILPTRACTNGQWITITTAGATDKPLGNRVDPTQAAAGKFAKVLTVNNQPALASAIPSACWQLHNFEVAVDSSFTGVQYHLLQLGDGGWAGGGEKQTSYAAIPTSFVLRRMYVHGATNSNLVRCISLNSANTSIVDSWIDECHVAGFDSQAIEGWNGSGPYLIENNFLAGAGENIMFGGADPGIKGLIPCDITIRRNHIWKDPRWKGRYQLKNLVELKNACRVLYEENELENSFIDAQMGMAVVFKSSQDVCGTCVWEGTTDVTFRRNRVRFAHRGLNIQGYDNAGQAITNQHTRRVAAYENLFIDIGKVGTIAPSDGWLMLLTHDDSGVVVRNNTFMSNTQGYGLAVYTAYGSGTARAIDIQKNVLAGQSYYALAGDGGNHTAALTAFAGTSWTFKDNLVSQVDGQFQPLSPAGNTYVDAVASLGLLPSGAFSPTSPYVNSGAGANVADLTWRLVGVASTIPVTRGSPPRTAPPKATAADSVWMAHQPKEKAPNIRQNPATAPRRR
jgi:hypothetical protein